MKKGKIVLSTAAIVVTTASVFAFKVGKKIGVHRLYYQFTDWGNPISCHVCSNAWKCTRGRCLNITGCTIDGFQYAVSILYTIRTDAHIVCQDPTQYYQIVQ